MPSPASSSEQVGEVVALGLVEAGRRLVEQQHLGPGGQRPPQLDQAGQAGGHGVDPLVGDRADARPGRGSPRRRRAGRRCGRATSDRRISAAVRMFSRAVSEPNTSRRWNVRAMPRRARGVGLEVGDVLAVEQHPAADGLLQAGDDVERGRLARRRSGRSAR